LELEDVAGRRVRNYSGGMKKRLDLASALVHRPKLIFLDEPTTGLDPQSRAAIWAYLEKLNKEEGTTIFLTTARAQTIVYKRCRSFGFAQLPTMRAMPFAIDCTRFIRP
jgi:ABC-type multidrug transport system ATPase subunit